eukprot:gene14121-20075_t
MSDLDDGGGGAMGNDFPSDAIGVAGLPLAPDGLESMNGYLACGQTRLGGSLVKWLKKKGDPVALYDIICEVETDELVEEVFKVGDFAGNVTLLVESQEEGILADILVG